MVGTKLFANQQLYADAQSLSVMRQSQNRINNADATLPATCHNVATPQARLWQKFTLRLTCALECCQKQHWQSNAVRNTVMQWGLWAMAPIIIAEKRNNFFSLFHAVGGMLLRLTKGCCQ